MGSTPTPSALIFVAFLLPFYEAGLVAAERLLCYHVSMPDSTKEIVKPSAEAVTPFVPPEVSPHVETVSDMEHLARIHSELSSHGVETRGELTQVSTEPQALDSSQFEIKSEATVKPPRAQGPGKFDDPSFWGSIFMRKQQERRERAA
ncbi:MAG: hypothetical protein A3C30_03970 [Candidatus Levybacteria bacterium RIFCSPHIGHO2_02_FULL_40_18]|nr:MAG: hypothetical protein A2869_00590 [Candidatus Levybacteria bacterium RIFCSPHIGHO2_01_FULL_40_58]OGH26240.1 MAG: hypothetical protein A3C30_03970 [Candidatus Levybacteria bacterium RIFCSPHIGHO2_02_FULL_40_18]OGH31492.1 MAG: hypothetical protein A3E43_03010 [Candidatus Levybacteria bacterium RIFCSPHIGHO2_12_FULL_40_31]OGH40132.1 MAG: hypothetical protein A2894_04330 [Candidatus Levybacteria bacterium RIFCSPLOWO2_01_FULL_40_64]OGH49085.1 MAG: hypothetical protein A3I54_00755 [Candidatus Lev